MIRLACHRKPRAASRKLLAIGRPDDYLRKMKQDLSEVEAQVESKTRYVPDPDFSPPPDDDASTTTRQLDSNRM